MIKKKTASKLAVEFLQFNKVNVPKPYAQWRNLTCLLFDIGTKQVRPLSSLLFNIGVQVLDNAIRKGEEIKGVRTEREKEQLSLFTKNKKTKN